MTQVENLEKYIEYAAATQVGDLIATGRDYTPLDPEVSASNEVWDEHKVRVVPPPVGIWGTFEEAWDSGTASLPFKLFSSETIFSSASDRTVVADDAESQSLRQIVAFARAKGQAAVADRLLEISSQPIEELDTRLKPDSAKCLVAYCIARGNPNRPLITVTPSGELDATWKGSDEQYQVVRFFPNRNVWVAYRLEHMTGSFESTLDNLLNPSLGYNLPDWA